MEVAWWLLLTLLLLVVVVCVCRLGGQGERRGRGWCAVCTRHQR